MRASSAAMFMACHLVIWVTFAKDYARRRRAEEISLPERSRPRCLVPVDYLLIVAVIRFDVRRSRHGYGSGGDRRAPESLTLAATQGSLDRKSLRRQPDGATRTSAMIALGIPCGATAFHCRWRWATGLPRLLAEWIRLARSQQVPAAGGC